MKTYISIFTGLLIFLLFSCQSMDGIENYMSEVEISALGITNEDANRKLSGAPNGVVTVKTENQSVEINFGLSDENSAYIKETYGGPSVLDTISTVGKLISTYKEVKPHFEKGWSSLCYPPNNGNYVIPKLAYTLAQECFHNNCSSQTRKAVLQIAVGKQIVGEEYIINYAAKRISIFLMTVILAKEQDTDFLTAVSNNQDLRNAMSLKTDDMRFDDEFYNYVKRFAQNFLINQ